jgi:hypothetical protein
MARASSSKCLQHRLQLCYHLPPVGLNFRLGLPGFTGLFQGLGGLLHAGHPQGGGQSFEGMGTTGGGGGIGALLRLQKVRLKVSLGLAEPQ